MGHAENSSGLVDHTVKIQLRWILFGVHSASVMTWLDAGGGDSVVCVAGLQKWIVVGSQRSVVGTQRGIGGRKPGPWSGVTPDHRTEPNGRRRATRRFQRHSCHARARSRILQMTGRFSCGDLFTASRRQLICEGSFQVPRMQIAIQALAMQGVGSFKYGISI